MPKQELVVKQLPKTSKYRKPLHCSWLRESQRQHGPMVMVRVTSGPGWWELDDLLRTAATGYPPEESVPRHIAWCSAGLTSWWHTAAAYMPEVVCAFHHRGALDRLVVVEMPDALNCTHPSCTRRGAKAAAAPAG